MVGVVATSCKGCTTGLGGCHEAVQVLEGVTHPKSNAVGDLASQLFQWEISGKHTPGTTGTEVDPPKR